MRAAKYRWRHHRWDNYYYFESDKYGLGHVIAREDGYHASGKHTSRTFRRLRDAKRFVEKSWRR